MTTCLEKSCSFGFTVRVFRDSERLSICVSASFPFGVDGRMLDLIVLIPDHYFSINFSRV